MFYIRYVSDSYYVFWAIYVYKSEHWFVYPTKTHECNTLAAT